MNIVNKVLSEKLTTHLMNWIMEHDNNLEHDVNDCVAWNELVCYLMELEKDVV